MELNVFYKDIRMHMFQKKFAIGKMLRHSHRLREMHAAAQKVVLRHDGVQGGGLNKALRHWSWAAHRFESEGGPWRHACCTLNATILTLCEEVEDMRRQTKERAAHEATLQALTPSALIGMGIGSDFQAHGVDFLRKFDNACMDPATVSRLVREFKEELRVLFSKGQILHQSNEGTLTWIVLKQMEARKVFFFRGQSLTLGWPGGAGQALKALRNIQAVVRSVNALLDVEFSEDYLVQCFECFDLLTWHQVRKAAQVVSDVTQRWASTEEARLLAKLRKLCTARGWDPAPIRARFLEMLPLASAAFRKHLPKGKCGPPPPLMANREAWLLACDSSAGAQNVHCFKRMLCFYLSTCPSTSNVERLLGQLARQLLMRHADVSALVLRDCISIVQYGPKTKESLATRGVVNGGEGQAVQLTPSPYLRACTDMWVRFFGRRYMVNSKHRSDKGQARPRIAGTDCSVALRRRAAVSKLLQEHADRESSSAGQAAQQELQPSLLPGVTLNAFAESDATAGFVARCHSEAMQKHEERARAKKAKLDAEETRRKNVRGQFMQQARAKHAPRRAACAAMPGQQGPQLLANPKVFVPSSCKDVVLPDNCVRVTRLIDADIMLLSSLQEADRIRGREGRLSLGVFAGALLGRQAAELPFLVAPQAHLDRSVCFAPITHSRLGVVANASFKKDHSGTWAILKHVCSQDDSKWKILDERGVTEWQRCRRTVVHIHSMNDAHEVVKKHAIIDRSRTCRGTYHLKVCASECSTARP